MNRLQILLYIFLFFAFEVSIAGVQKQPIILSGKSEMSSIEKFCISSLGAEMGFNDFWKKMKLSFSPEIDEEAGVFAIKVLWNEIPAVRAIFRSLALETHRNIDRDNRYKVDLISSILKFIQALSKKIIGEDHLEAMKGVDSVNLSEDQINILTYQIGQLEPLAQQLETLSPVESFIYTDILNNAVEYLKGIDDARMFDLGQYIDQEYKKNFAKLDLSSVLRSFEQREHLFQQYQLLLLQRYSNRIVETNSNSLTEQEMREQGYSENVISGFDHAKDNLYLAQSLRARDINPVATHIPEFAELIDEHINYIRKGIVDSQEFSSSEKTERLELLDVLESRAQAYKAAEELTYFRWLHLNLSFSMLTTPDSDLLNDKELHSFMFIDQRDTVDFESFRRWVIDDDGSSFLKIADIFRLYEELESYEDSNYNHKNEGTIKDVIEDIIGRLGLNLTFESIRLLKLVLQDDKELFVKELSRQLGLNFHVGNVHVVGLENFVYLFNRFPERIMIPTIHDLGFMAITRTHNRGIHLIGLNNKSNSFGFYLHDIAHSVKDYVRSDPQIIDRFESQLESLPKLFKELMEEAYLDLTHETSTGIPLEVMIRRDVYNNNMLITEAVERYKEEQRQILFQYVSGLGHLTEAEELELRKTILVLNYLELVSIYTIAVYEDIESMEGDLVNISISLRLIPRLYSLYEQEQRLLDTLDNSN